MNFLQQRYYKTKLEEVKDAHLLDVKAWTDVKSIAVFCSYENDEQLKEIQKEVFSPENKSINTELIIFNPTQTPICSDELNVFSVSKKDFNWHGALKKDFPFLNKSYDVLINAIAENMSLREAYLFNLISANIKIGREENFAQLYQFIVKIQKDVTFKQYLDYIKKYTSRLGSED